MIYRCFAEAAQKFFGASFRALHRFDKIGPIVVNAPALCSPINFSIIAEMPSSSLASLSGIAFSTKSNFASVLLNSVTVSFNESNPALILRWDSSDWTESAETSGGIVRRNSVAGWVTEMNGSGALTVIPLPFRLSPPFAATFSRLCSPSFHRTIWEKGRFLRRALLKKGQHPAAFHRWTEGALSTGEQCDPDCPYRGNTELGIV